MYQVCWFWSKSLYWYTVSLRAQEETEINSEVQVQRFKPRDNLQGHWQVRGNTGEAESPETGKPPSSGGRYKERTVLVEWQLERRGGLGRIQSWKGDSLDISQGHCFTPAALTYGGGRKKHPSFSFLSPACAFHGPNQKPLERISFQGQEEHGWGQQRTAQAGSSAT